MHDVLEQVEMGRNDYVQITILIVICTYFISLACRHVETVEIVKNAYKSYLAHLNTSLSVSWNHVSVERHGRKLLVTTLGTSQYFLIPSLHIRIWRNCQELLLIALDTSQYSLILSLQTCWNTWMWAPSALNL